MPDQPETVRRSTMTRWEVGGFSIDNKIACVVQHGDDLTIGTGYSVTPRLTRNDLQILVRLLQQVINDTPHLAHTEPPDA